MSKSSFYRKWRQFLDALEAEGGAENPGERGGEPANRQQADPLQDNKMSKKIIPIGRQ